MDRVRHRWKVQLQDEDGRIHDSEEFSAYWDPKQEGMADEVARACAAMTTVRTGKQHVGLTAVLQP